MLHTGLLDVIENAGRGRPPSILLHSDDAGGVAFAKTPLGKGLRIAQVVVLKRDHVGQAFTGFMDSFVDRTRPVCSTVFKDELVHSELPFPRGATKSQTAASEPRVASRMASQTSPSKMCTSRERGKCSSFPHAWPLWTMSSIGFHLLAWYLPLFQMYSPAISRKMIARLRIFSSAATSPIVAPGSRSRASHSCIFCRRAGVNPWPRRAPSKCSTTL